MNCQDFLQLLQIITNLAIVGTFIVYWRLLSVTVKQVEQHSEETHRVSRQNAWRDLFLAFDHINDYTGRADDVMIPPYPEFKCDRNTSALLFHHINLIFRFWLNKELMSKDECEGFERWIDKVFFPWIEKKEELAVDLRTIVEFKDLYPASFLDWLTRQGGYDRASRLSQSYHSH